MKVTFAGQDTPTVPVSSLSAGQAFIDAQGDLCLLVSVGNGLGSLILTVGRTTLSVPFMFAHSPDAEVTPVDIEIIVHQ